MVNIFNKKKLIGQKVNDGRSNGVIDGVTTGSYESGAYVVRAKFEDGRECLFTKDGSLDIADTLPCLRFGHLKSTEIDYGEPEWTADWDNHKQYKFYIKYNHRTGKWDIAYNTYVQVDGVKYMSGEEVEKIVKYKNENGIKP